MSATVLFRCSRYVLLDVPSIGRDVDKVHNVNQLRWDGVPGDCERPNDEQQNEHLQAALRQFEGHPQYVIAGNLDDLRNRTIGDLRRDRRRLIMLRDVDSMSTYTGKQL